MPNTKIVATLGPASESPEMLKSLLEAGVNVIRLNASHGTHAKHAEWIHAIRKIGAECGKDPAILFDLQGPKIRLGKFQNGGCVLETGATFSITIEPVLGTAELASTSYSRFAKDVKAGDRVLLADGTVELRALKSDGISVRLEVISGGPISDNKGINLPGVYVSAPSLTEKDIADVKFGLEQGVDMYALSFVRSADDVRQLRSHLEERTPRAPIVAKIEKPQSWENIDTILDEADGVMVARGDLGVEMALERVPFIQKAIIRRSRRRSKFVITATQMLESMVDHPTPTRAEVSDVANAIYDGTDAVMLSAETSVGKYPVGAVKFMARIVAEAERSMRARGFQEVQHSPTHANYAEIIANAAYHAARDASVSAIVVYTATGGSARLISRFRPPDPIFAITPSKATSRNLLVQFGVTPILAPETGSTDEMLSQADCLLVEGGFLRQGDSVVFVAGQPVGRPGTTNLMKLHRIGELR
jgi:pyruvate kinase